MRSAGRVLAIGGRARPVPTSPRWKHHLLEVTFPTLSDSLWQPDEIDRSNAQIRIPKKSWTIVWRNNWCICKARNTIVTAAVVANAEKLRELKSSILHLCWIQPFLRCTR